MLNHERESRAPKPYELGANAREHAARPMRTREPRSSFRGVPMSELPSWHDVGVPVYLARKWRAHFTPEQAVSWLRWDFSLREARRWAKHEFAAANAVHYRRMGLSPRRAASQRREYDRMATEARESR
jgi:hypothetical protein